MASDPSPVTDSEGPLADAQSVLVSSTGRHYHLPRTSGDGPVCSTECTVGEWLPKEYSLIGENHDLCGKCLDMLENHPSVVAFDDGG